MDGIPDTDGKKKRKMREKEDKGKEEEGLRIGRSKLTPLPDRLSTAFLIPTPPS
jgi:hypothetical protein